MRRRTLLAFGLCMLLGATASAQAPPILQVQAPDEDTGSPPSAATPDFGTGEDTGQAAESGGGYGPYPIQKLHYLQDLLRRGCGKSPLDDNLKPTDGCGGPSPLPLSPEARGGKVKDPCLRIFGWADFDYSYRSTGPGNNPIAPVMNHFGNEFLVRENGLYVSRPLDPKELSWGFNSILIAGSDASFLNPIKGWFTGDEFGPGGSSRYSISFTDLNLTAHLPILTEGGVDVKGGRQTTILGPMGAVSWQRWFNSSDYAWYNMEEGRYTGISTTWHVSKRFDWYNGIEFGWGTFFAQIDNHVDYITNLSYWLDEDAKKTKVWTTVLTGPTSLNSGANTTVVEVGLQHSWSERVYQIIDTQMVYSRGPVNRPVPPGYIQRAYDVYTYLGYHLTKCLDLQGRYEWYFDVDGRNYAGGFGIPNTHYNALTVGVDYHPTRWVQFRPEIRYDHASNPAFGRNFDHKNQLSISADMLFKF